MPVAILLYHQIDTPPARKVPFRSMFVGADAFTRQMAWLKRLGYQGLSLRDSMPYILGQKTGKVAAITFDDGFTNVYRNAMPVLDAFGFTATNFIVVNQIGGTNDWDRKLGVGPAPCMDKHEIIHWVSRGHEIGAHTMDHVHLSQMTGDQALKQISQCRQSLQAVTGEPVGAFAYPYGDQNAAVRDLVRQSGYAFGVGTQRRRAVPADDIWNLPRLTVRRDDTWLHFLAKCTMR